MEARLSKQTARVTASTVLISSGSKRPRSGFASETRRSGSRSPTARVARLLLALEVAQDGLERLGPRAAAVAQVGGAGRDAVAVEVEVAVDVPEHPVQPLHPEHGGSSQIQQTYWTRSSNRWRLNCGRLNDRSGTSPP